jgi:hypothetical protein
VPELNSSDQTNFFAVSVTGGVTGVVGVVGLVGVGAGLGASFCAQNDKDNQDKIVKRWIKRIKSYCLLIYGYLIRAIYVKYSFFVGYFDKGT